jgi:TPR repeat protein
MAISVVKLTLIAVLGALALFTGAIVLSLQLVLLKKQHLLQQRRVLQQQGKQPQQKSQDASSTTKKLKTTAVVKPITSTSVQNSNPTSLLDLAKTRHVDTGSSRTTAANAYWNQVAAVISDWDALVTATLPTWDGGSDDDHSYYWSLATSGSTTGINSTERLTRRQRRLSRSGLLHALYEAAQMGQPDAQFYLANALASGIWPVGPDSGSSSGSGGSSVPSLSMDDGWKLVVSEDIVPPSTGDNKQITDIVSKEQEEKETEPQDDLQQQRLRQQSTQSWVYWHMAAMAGNVEAAMALAYRLEKLGPQQAPVCDDIMPYYEAAAHGVIDQLEASPNSRAKVTPPQDKHNLAEVYMHGGEAGKLQWNNKPDESPEALQFYHLRATRKEGPDIGAAFTLAQYYHYGIRGVSQNLTTALQYYETAANQGHWEAAGQAGKFYFWGLGMEAHQRDLMKANKYFTMGAPFSLEGCQERHYKSVQQMKKQVKKDVFGEDLPDTGNEKIAECDHPSVNGLGLIALFGIPYVSEVDRELALQLFILARDMGNMDAAYNVAMMRLGWKTSWKRLNELDSNGQTIVDANGVHTSTSDATGFWRDVANHGKDQDKPKRHARTTSTGPSQADYLMALQDLQGAANKGHVQARHRLAMLHANGVKGVTAHGVSFTAIPQDCNKALKHYKWVAENGSPQLSQRLRKAYKQYMTGDKASSLRNYLAAAESGSELAQVNAAFLLERGECLDLSPTDCAKASVRLWKAAANQNSAEASLRVGDFYYYGRLRDQRRRRIGPYAWAHHLIYPEQLVPVAAQAAFDFTVRRLQQQNNTNGDDEGGPSRDDEEKSDDEDENFESVVDRDLAMAARYYRLAAERHKSARAHFNLGFMHEWG